MNAGLTTADLATVLAQPAGVAAGWRHRLCSLIEDKAPRLNPLTDLPIGTMVEALADSIIAAAPPAPSLPADRDDTAALVEAADKLEWAAQGYYLDRTPENATELCEACAAVRRALANRTPPQPASDGDA